MLQEILPWLLPVLLIAGFMVFKMLGQVPTGQVAGLLAQGAVVVDVRGPDEFSSDHLQGVINLPLDTLEKSISSVVSDKNQPMLLHCLSGTRSALAARKLKSLGYTRVYNLGSISRARAILNQSGIR